MDIIREKVIAFREVAQAISDRKVIVGAKQLRKALTSGIVCHVFLAADADPAITEPIRTLCRLHNVEVTLVRTMADLGKACGIAVGAAAAAVVNSR